jgi:cytochrome c-type biogenesis protein CcmH
MLLWLVFAVLTAGALAALLWPLARPARALGGEGAGVKAVFRDQMDEIEAERARGAIAEAEAEAVKLELSRRALASAAAESTRSSRRPPLPPARGRLAVAVAAAVPLLTVGLYLAYGSPDTFFAAGGHSVDKAQIGVLIAEVEQRLRERPDDGRGWDVVAPVYLKLGRFREAADAYQRAALLEGESLQRLSGFAVATVLAADGRVDAEAQRVYEKILRIEPGNVEARYWLALAKEQDGKLDLALADYNRLLSEAPADAPWRGAIEGRIADLAARLTSKVAPESGGPSAEDVAAASKLSPEDRAKYIARMVDGLAERLQRDGGDLAGWQRLIHAYAVLGRDQDARQALEDARRRFYADARALGELAALAKSLGLGS